MGVQPPSTKQVKKGRVPAVSALLIHPPPPHTHTHTHKKKKKKNPPGASIISNKSLVSNKVVAKQSYSVSD